MTNDKRWQENSDGWVKTMNESKERKAEKRRLEGACNHDDWSWCDTCAFDRNGERVAQKGIDY